MRLAVSQANRDGLCRICNVTLARHAAAVTGATVITPGESTCQELQPDELSGSLKGPDITNYVDDISFHLEKALSECSTTLEEANCRGSGRLQGAGEPMPLPRDSRSDSVSTFSPKKCESPQQTSASLIGTPTLDDFSQACSSYVVFKR